MVNSKKRKENDLREELGFWGRILYARHYIVATDGNISSRLNSDSILITPKGLCKGMLLPKELVRLNLSKPEKSKDFNRASSEYRMHLVIYQQRKDVSAIIHAHPFFSTLFALQGKKLDSNLLDEVALTVGNIEMVNYYPPGSVELAQAVRKQITKSNALLLRRHGIVVIGNDLAEAYYRLERVEFLAKITYYQR